MSGFSFTQVYDFTLESGDAYNEKCHSWSLAKVESLFWVLLHLIFFYSKFSLPGLCRDIAYVLWASVWVFHLHGLKDFTNSILSFSRSFYISVECIFM